MKIYFTLIIISISCFSLSAQDKIAEFITTRISLAANQNGHINNGATSAKMEIKFQLFEDKLILNYLDKKTIKSMEKIGQPTNLEFPYVFSKESNNQAVWYKYQDDAIQIMVMLEGNPTPSVTIKSKDDFTGKVTSNQLYYSIPNK